MKGASSPPPRARARASCVVRRNRNRNRNRILPDETVIPSPLPTFSRQFILALRSIRFSHTIFALPFALLAMILAAVGWPPARTVTWIVLACVFARSAAMAFNRLHDERFDRLNPRTRQWPLAAGILSRRFMIGFCLASCAGFILAAAMLNPLAFALSPVALLILLGYSTAKRWTPGTHFILGLALGIAPVGAWIGTTGALALPPLLLGLGVLCWVAGFDIIYSCQDEQFDRGIGLRSLPSRLGRARALALSALADGAAIARFAMVVAVTPLGMWYLAAVAAAALLLAYEQSLVSPRDISRLDVAFFTLNGWVSVLIFAGGACDLLN